MRILTVGDVVGKTGRRMVAKWVPPLVSAEGVDLVVLNGENAAGGNGLTHEVLDELLSLKVDVLTSGNHIFDKREIFEFIDDVPVLLRPINLPRGTPGHGYVVVSKASVPVAVVSLAGRAFMPYQYDDPFAAIDAVLSSLRHQVPIVVVDFHAETTSEKMALAWYLEDKVSLLVGTHTHVQTADERIFPQGMAYITDLGMTGPRDSVIGVRPASVIQKMRTQLPGRFETAVGVGQFGALLVEIDDATGKAQTIRRIFEYEQS